MINFILEWTREAFSSSSDSRLGIEYAHNLPSGKCQLHSLKLVEISTKLTKFSIFVFYRFVNISSSAILILSRQ